MSRATGTPARGWHAFFWIAAAFNLAVGAAGFAGQSEGAIELVVSLLVFCFGVIYALVARDPLRFAPVLWAGVLGKLGVVVLLGLPNWRSGGDPLIGTVVAGDLLFALVFLAFLLGPARRAG